MPWERLSWLMFAEMTDPVVADSLMPIDAEPDTVEPVTVTLLDAASARMPLPPDWVAVTFCTVMALEPESRTPAMFCGATVKPFTTTLLRPTRSNPYAWAKAAIVCPTAGLG